MGVKIVRNYFRKGIGTYRPMIKLWPTENSFLEQEFDFQLGCGLCDCNARGVRSGLALVMSD